MMHVAGIDLQNSTSEILIEAVGAIAQGGIYIDLELVQQLAMSMAAGQDEAAKLKRLSPREFDVFCLLENGYTAKEAAENCA